ncbi:hypothetical protein [Streptomyces lydicamycinicus]
MKFTTKPDVPAGKEVKNAQRQWANRKALLAKMRERIDEKRTNGGAGE